RGRGKDRAAAMTAIGRARERRPRAELDAAASLGCHTVARASTARAAGQGARRIQQRGGQIRGSGPEGGGKMAQPATRRGKDRLMFVPRKTVGQLVAEAKQRIENLTIEQLKAEQARGPVQVLDIRDVRERQKLGYIPGSIHVPRGMLEFWLDPTSHYYS